MSSNPDISGTTYPNEISLDPTKAPSSSTAQKPPPNLDPQMKTYEQTAGNPVKQASVGSVSQGTASIGKEDDDGAEGKSEDDSKGPIDKVKEKLGG